MYSFAPRNNTVYTFLDPKKLLRTAKYWVWFQKMAKITKKMKRDWDHWATVADLAKEFGISNRRVQQIIATNIDVIEKAVLVQVRNFGSGIYELNSIPIYRRILENAN